MSVLWHYIQNGTTQGPIPEEQLRGMITSGILHPTDQVWHEGMAGWTSLQSVPGLIALVPQGTPPPAIAPQTQPKKSGSVWLWILGGCGGLLLVILIGMVLAFLWVKKKVGNLQRNPAVAAAELLVQANPELEVVATDYAKGTITIRNRKTGETLTMDANEAKRGRFTFKDGKGSEVRFQVPEDGSDTVKIEGPEGQASFGTGSKTQAPSWLPTYPGTPVEGVMSTTGKNGLTGTVVQKTADAPARVFETFEKTLKAGGYTLGTVHTPDGGMVIGDQKASKRHVMATIGSSQGQTVVTINYREGN